jgi:two-component system LytT family sensor kinase
MKLSLEKILPIVLCLLFPVLNYITSHEYIESGQIKTDTILRWTVISVMLYLLWHVLYFINNKAETYKWLKIVLGCAIFLIVAYNVFSLFPFFRNRPVKWLFVYKSFIAIVPFTIIQYALRTNRRVVRLELEKEQVQTENYRVQLEALRSKVDPHFLFNSLNTLRAMVQSNHAQSEEFILNLADFYRQTLKYNENTTLTLSEELKVMEAFLFLMKSRNETGVQMKLMIDDVFKNMFLPTLSLQLLAENCFKHNVMSSKTPLLINVYTSADGYINVENNINPKIEIKEPSGYGLENLKKRYDLLGIDNGICIVQTETSFCVKLKLITL